MKAAKRFAARLFAVCLVPAALGLAPEGAGTTITISLLGDCAIADQYCYQGSETSLTARVGREGMDYPFRLVQKLLAADDLTLANCEGTFTERPLGKGGKAMSLCAPIEYAKVFALGGVDVVTLANNHSRDFGDKGLEDTVRALDSAGVVSFGVGRPAIVTIKGVKIGLTGYCYPITDVKMGFYEQAFAMLRQAGCEFIIASIHAGKEDCASPNQEQLKRCPQLIDLGADMVYGHGAHVLQPIRLYKGKLIFYGLGNFVFGANPKPNDDDTALISVTYRRSVDGTLMLSALQALPMKVHRDSNYQPYPILDEEGKRRVYQKLVFSKPSQPSSDLTEGFLMTGEVTFTAP